MVSVEEEEDLINDNEDKRDVEDNASEVDSCMWSVH